MNMRALWISFFSVLSINCSSGPMRHPASAVSSDSASDVYKQREANNASLEPDYPALLEKCKSGLRAHRFPEDVLESTCVYLGDPGASRYDLRPDLIAENADKLADEGLLADPTRSSHALNVAISAVTYEGIDVFQGIQLACMKQFVIDVSAEKINSVGFEDAVTECGSQKLGIGYIEAVNSCKTILWEDEKDLVLLEAIMAYNRGGPFSNVTSRTKNMALVNRVLKYLHSHMQGMQSDAVVYSSVSEFIFNACEVPNSTSLLTDVIKSRPIVQENARCFDFLKERGLVSAFIFENFTRKYDPKIQLITCADYLKRK